MPFCLLPLLLFVGVLVPELEASSSRICKRIVVSQVKIFVQCNITESWFDWSFFLGWTVFLRRMGFFVLKGDSSVFKLFESANLSSSFLFFGDFPCKHELVITSPKANNTYFSFLRLCHTSFILWRAKRRHGNILKHIFIIHKILGKWLHFISYWWQWQYLACLNRIRDNFLVDRRIVEFVQQLQQWSNYSFSFGNFVTSHLE